MKNYSSSYGEEIPGNGNIAFHKNHYETVVHGFQHHKAQRALDLETLEYLIEQRQMINYQIKHLRKQIKQ